MRTHSPQSPAKQTVAHQPRATQADGPANSDQASALAAHHDEQTLARAELLTALPGAIPRQGALGVAQYDEVESKSQSRQLASDNTFHHLDGDHALGLTMDPAPAGTPLSTSMHMGRSGEAQAAGEAAHLKACNGIDTLGEYRTMLVQDFNFGMFVTRYAGPLKPTRPRTDVRAAGETPFLRAVVGRFYPGATLDFPEAQACVEIARNIWSYATCGTDCSGNSDIAEMQGLLYVFDQEVRDSSDTNTTMADGKDAEDYFVVPGTEAWDTPIKLLKGDGRHGRATVLTTRHLLGGMTEGSADEDLDGYGTSYLLLDRSPSVQSDEYALLAGLVEKGGFDGELALAGFDSDGKTLRKVNNGEPLSREEAARLLQAASDRVTGDPNVRGAPSALVERIGSSQEQGLAAALQWLEDPSVSATSDKRRQLLVVTDEPDFNPDVLRKVQDVARRKSISVKVMYAFNTEKPSAYGDSVVSNAFVVVDVMAIKVLLDAWRVDREGLSQLDWLKVADAQHAEVQDWGPR